MRAVFLAALLAASAACAAPGRAQGGPPAPHPGNWHPEKMRYFILNGADQPGGHVGHAFVVLIGHADAPRFLVEYDGSATPPGGTRQRRRLTLDLLHQGSVVGTVRLADLGAARGWTRVNTHLDASAATALDDIDAVQARIVTLAAE